MASPEEEQNSQPALDTPAISRQEARKSYDQTPAAQRISRDQELADIVALLRQAVAERRQENRRLLIVEGDAGVGKSWFLQNLQRYLQKYEPGWRLLGSYQAEAFVGPAAYGMMLQVLTDCASHPPLIPAPLQPTASDVADCAANLDHQLAHAGQPLVLFFDEGERWIGLEDTARRQIEELFRIVWGKLLHRVSVPCLIICAARRLPPFGELRLRNAEHRMELAGLPPDQLTRLAERLPADVLGRWIERVAENNPLVTRLLDQVLAPYQGTKVDDLPWPAMREAMYQAILDDRVTGDLCDLLRHLARTYPAGFVVADLPTWAPLNAINRLILTSFVKADVIDQSLRYLVSPVLTRLFREDWR